MYDVVALGELLIDLAPGPLSENGNKTFEVCPGGAPCNVLSMLQQLGKKTAFIGRVGNDQFGEMLRATLLELGISDAGLSVDKSVNTTLTFIHLLENGDRDFSFYRNPGADMMLSEEDVSEDLISQAKIFHFGTLSSTSPSGRAATQKAVRLAKKHGCIISLDPNLRPPLWSSMDEAKEQMLKAIELCDILKISDNEIQFVTGIQDYDKAVAYIRDKYKTPLVLLTLGKKGSRAYYKDLCVEAPIFDHDKVVDTTGAGDTFCACALSYIIENGFDFDEKALLEMISFGNAAAGLITMHKGAMKAMPTREEVEKVISGCQL